MGMDATLYLTTLDKAIDKIGYETLEVGYTNSFIDIQKTDVILLDLIGEDLQRWAETNLGACGYISMFMTEDLHKAIKEMLTERHSEILAEWDWQSRVGDLFKDPENFLFVEFN
jgi:hypothetical protein